MPEMRKDLLARYSREEDGVTEKKEPATKDRLSKNLKGL